MNFLARVISFLTNPLFVLFPVPYLLVNRFSNIPTEAYKWSMVSFFFFFLIAGFMYYEVKHKVFTNFDISDRKQRPVLFGFIFFIIISYLFSLFTFRGPIILYVVIVGIMLGVVLVSYVNTRIKASIHLATLISVLITFYILYSFSFLYFLLVPVVAWSRITLKRHTLAETIAGGSVGAFLTIFMYTIVKYVFHVSF